MGEYVEGEFVELVLRHLRVSVSKIIIYKFTLLSD